MKSSIHCYRHHNNTPTNTSCSKPTRILCRSIRIPRDVPEMNSIMHSHAMSGDVEGALGLLQVMKNELDLKPDVITMNTIIKITITRF